MDNKNMSIIERLLTPLMYIRKLEELMEESKHSEKSDVTSSIDEHETKIKSSENSQKNQHLSRQLTSVNPQSSLLSLLDRKHWGVLGELRNQAGLYVESNQLSLYHESTPWKRYLRRNRGAVAVAAGLMVIISVGFIVQTSTKLDLLQQQIEEGEQLIQTELRSVLPKTSDLELKSMLLKLKEKIEPSNKISPKKVTRSLNNLLKVEQDLKKMNSELKKVVKKVKTLEKENSKLQKKLNKR